MDNALAALPENLRSLAARGQLKTFAPGAVLIRENEIGEGLFLVLSGRLRVFANSVADGREVVYGHCEVGDYVGEMSLDGGPRTASVAAETEALCACIDRAALLEHLREYPQFGLELLTKVLRRVRQTTANLKALARGLD